MKKFVIHPLPKMRSRTLSAPAILSAPPKIPTRTFTPEKSLFKLEEEESRRKSTGSSNGSQRKPWQSAQNVRFVNNCNRHRAETGGQGLVNIKPVSTSSHPVDTKSTNRRAQSLLSILGSLSPDMSKSTGSSTSTQAKNLSLSKSLTPPKRSTDDVRRALPPTPSSPPSLKQSIRSKQSRSGGSSNNKGGRPSATTRTLIGSHPIGPCSY